MHALLFLLALAVPLGDEVDTCRTCHPGSIKGLGQGPHRRFLSEPPAGGACGSCHGDSTAHVQSAAVPGTLRPPPAVSKQACDSCHRGRNYAPEQAAHRFVPAPAAGAEQAPATQPATLQPQAASSSGAAPAGSRPVTLGGMELHGALAAGLRLVKVNGSEARYNQDLNLDQGFRLLEASLSGTGKAGQGAVDRFELSARDVDDPHQEYRGEVARQGLYRARAGYTRTTYVYDPGGDFQTFDFTRKLTYTGLDVDVARDVRLFGSFERLERDGVWTGNRIGNQNVQPLTSVSGVTGPRTLTNDRVEAGVAARSGRWNGTLAGRYEDQDALDQRSYSRPAPVNPAFPESEDWRADQSLRGPGARLTVRGDLDAEGAWTFELLADAAFPVRRGVFAGTTRGFDIDEFVTRTSGESRGTARQFHEDATLSWQAAEDASVTLDFRRIDRDEHSRLQLLDVTTYPNLGLTTSQDGSADLRTNHEVTEGSLSVEARVAPTLTVTGGYGIAAEHLKLPSYPASGNDFQSGTIVTHGVVAAVAFRPDPEWTASVDFRGFGTGDRQVNETTPELGREIKGRLRYGPGGPSSGQFGELFVRHRHGESDQTPSWSDFTTLGITGQLLPCESLELRLTQAETWIDSLALTNFFYAPSPTPVPTYVGFEGITYQTTVGVSWTPVAPVTWSHDLLFLRTNGDFDVRVVRYFMDLVYRATAAADVGVRGEIDSYKEEPAPVASNYLAYLGMLYVRFKL